MKHKWTLQHTGYPVAGRAIQYDEWKDLSKHASLNAAVKRYSREREHLDPHSWDDHYRIIDPDGNIIDMWSAIVQAADEKVWNAES